MAERAPITAAESLRHDVRNQLNQVVGYGELLCDDAGDTDPEWAAVLGEVCAHARRAAAAVDDLDPPTPTALGEIEAVLDDLTDSVRRARTSAVARQDESTLDDMTRIEEAATRALVTIETYATSSAAATEMPTPGAAARPGGRSAGAAPDAEGQVVLVVDDDEGNRDLLARRLERLGYSVMVAEDGAQALGVLEVEPVDLILLDLMMPVLDGFGVLEQRNADERLRTIPVVMISSDSDTDRVARCVEMGADDYLPKPFDPVLLRARIGACLERKRLSDLEKELLAEVQRQSAELLSLNQDLEERVRTQVEEIGNLARLRRFLSPQLADLVVSAGGEELLRSHRREIAVLFCDLRGFTSFSEVAEPEEVMEVLGQFHRAIGDCTHEFGATVGFFAGDGIMVFFNDPLPCPNPAEQALRMAVAVRDRMAAMTRDWRRRGHEVGFGVGISYGYATLGEIGFHGRYDYGVIGSVVNLAARLCDQARHGQILISKRAHTAVEEFADSEEVGELTLKGIHGPVTAFNVVGLKPTVTTPVAHASVASADHH
jgi:adenylate cyclase